MFDSKFDLDGNGRLNKDDVEALKSQLVSTADLEKVTVGSENYYVDRNHNSTFTIYDDSYNKIAVTNKDTGIASLPSGKMLYVRLDAKDRIVAGDHLLQDLDKNGEVAVSDREYLAGQTYFANFNIPASDFKEKTGDGWRYDAEDEKVIVAYGNYTTNNADTLTYDLSLEEAGTYKIGINIDGLTAEGLEAQYHADFILNIDGAKRYIRVKAGETSGSTEFALTKGSHAIELSWVNRHLLSQDKDVRIKDIYVSDTRTDSLCDLNRDGMITAADLLLWDLESPFEKDSYKVNIDGTDYFATALADGRMVFKDGSQWESFISDKEGRTVKIGENEFIIHLDTAARDLTVSRRMEADINTDGYIDYADYSLFTSSLALTSQSKYALDHKPLAVKDENRITYLMDDGSILLTKEEALAHLTDEYKTELELTYDFTVGEDSDYVFGIFASEFSTITSGYRYDIAVMVDGEKAGYLQVKQDLTQVMTDTLILEGLSAGKHSITLKWTNAGEVEAATETTLRIKSIYLRNEAVAAECDLDGNGIVNGADSAIWQDARPATADHRKLVLTKPDESEEIYTAQLNFDGSFRVIDKNGDLYQLNDKTPYFVPGESLPYTIVATGGVPIKEYTIDREYTTEVYEIALNDATGSLSITERRPANVVKDGKIDQKDIEKVIAEAQKSHLAYEASKYVNLEHEKVTSGGQTKIIGFKAAPDSKISFDPREIEQLGVSAREALADFEPAVVYDVSELGAGTYEVEIFMDPVDVGNAGEEFTTNIPFGFTYKFDVYAKTLSYYVGDSRKIDLFGDTYVVTDSTEVVNQVDYLNERTGETVVYVPVFGAGISLGGRDYVTTKLDGGVIQLEAHYTLEVSPFEVYKQEQSGRTFISGSVTVESGSDQIRIACLNYAKERPVTLQNVVIRQADVDLSADITNDGAVDEKDIKKWHQLAPGENNFKRITMGGITYTVISMKGIDEYTFRREDTQAEVSSRYSGKLVNLGSKDYLISTNAAGEIQLREHSVADIDMDGLVTDYDASLMRINNFVYSEKRKGTDFVALSVADYSTAYSLDSWDIDSGEGKISCAEDRGVATYGFDVSARGQFDIEAVIWGVEVGHRLIIEVYDNGVYVGDIRADIEDASAGNRAVLKAVELTAGRHDITLSWRNDDDFDGAETIGVSQVTIRDTREEPKCDINGDRIVDYQDIIAWYDAAIREGYIMKLVTLNIEGVPHEFHVAYSGDGIASVYEDATRVASTNNGLVTLYGKEFLVIKDSAGKVSLKEYFKADVTRDGIIENADLKAIAEAVQEYIAPSRTRDMDDDSDVDWDDVKLWWVAENFPDVEDINENGIIEVNEVITERNVPDTDEDEDVDWVDLIKWSLRSSTGLELKSTVKEIPASVDSTPHTYGFVDFLDGSYQTYDAVTGAFMSERDRHYEAYVRMDMDADKDVDASDTKLWQDMRPETANITEIEITIDSTTHTCGIIKYKDESYRLYNTTTGELISETLAGQNIVTLEGKEFVILQTAAGAFKLIEILTQDINKDGYLDRRDKDIILAKLGQTSAVSPRADLNSDNVIDREDLLEYNKLVPVVGEEQIVSIDGTDYYVTYNEDGKFTTRKADLSEIYTSDENGYTVIGGQTYAMMVMYGMIAVNEAITSDVDGNNILNSSDLQILQNASGSGYLQPVSLADRGIITSLSEDFDFYVPDATSGNYNIGMEIAPVEEIRESYTDTNENGQYDEYEPFEDTNENGKWDYEELGGTYTTVSFRVSKKTAPDEYSLLGWFDVTLRVDTAQNGKINLPPGIINSGDYTTTIRFEWIDFPTTHPIQINKVFIEDAKYVKTADLDKSGFIDDSDRNIFQSEYSKSTGGNIILYDPAGTYTTEYAVSVLSDPYVAYVFTDTITSGTYTSDEYGRVMLPPANYEFSVTEEQTGEVILVRQNKEFDAS
ncbi:hypothetical protein ACFL5C_02355, partial [Candidatus Omnitrophota bacterium]